MKTSVMTLGVGRYRGMDFNSLMVELEQARRQYNIPDNAKYVKAPVGSPYALEVIWIAEA